jgi:dTDP-N-acetylfucosamine:lipid II N-acetylfucosaminyltransferase
MPKNNIKIAHFISDEKFPDSAFRQFEYVLPGSSDYFVASIPKKLKYVKEAPVTFINRLSFKNPLFMRRLNDYSFVVLHSLNSFNQELVAHSFNMKIKFVWIGMGYDYYDLIYNDKMELYLNKTKQIASIYGTKESNRHIDLKKFIKLMIYKNESKRDLLKRINYFAPVLENEYSILASKLGGKLPEYIPWNYSLASGKNIPLISGDNILIGNSASLTNNHIETIDFLKKILTSNRKIMCPLSYGDNKYGDYIESYGKLVLGDKFKSLRNFMTYSEYVNSISRCSHVIMNHLRQQAGGNVALMVLMGAKVFLNKQNPLFDHYKKLGATIFSMEELQKDPSMLNDKLTEAQANRNKEIMKKQVDWGNAIKKTENLIATVLK